MDQRTESIDNVTEGGIALRIIQDKRPGFAYTADFDEQSMDLLVDQAVENSKSALADQYAGFPSPKKQSKVLKLVEPNIDSTPLADKLKKRCEEIGEPDFFNKIADETVATDTIGLVQYLEKVNHPALTMPPLM